MVDNELITKNTISKGAEGILCQRCNVAIPTFSKMRKWCTECRHTVSLEQAKERKLRRSQVLE